MTDATRVSRARALAATASGPALDRLVALAANLLGVRHAQVSLLEDVQLVAVVHGRDAVSSPQADALCRATVTQRCTLAIPDARADERAASLPTVSSDAVGGYLGVPLTAPSGEVVGALCAYDPAPREWSADDHAVLRELAACVVTELELGWSVEALRETTTRLELGLSAAHVGTFDWDFTTSELHWDHRLEVLFGYGEAGLDPDLGTFLLRVHDEDRDAVRQAIAEAVAACGDFALEFRIVRPDGRLRWIVTRGQVLGDRSGLPVRLLGASFDTTESHDARHALVRQLEAMPSAFYSLDHEWRFTYLNAEGERVLGKRSHELLGRQLWEAFPRAAGSPFETHYRHAVAHQEPVTFEAYYPAPRHAWYEVRAWPVPEGLTVYFLDVTARRRAETEREHANERLRVLVEAGDQLSDSLEGGTVLARLAELTVPALGELVVVVVRDEVDAAITGRTTMPDPRRLVVQQVVHQDPVKQEALRELIDEHPPSLDDRAGSGLVVQTGEAEWFPLVAESFLRHSAHGDGSRLERLRSMGLASALVVPLMSRGRTLGAMTVAGPAGGELDRRLVEEVASRAAAALDNAVLYAESQRVGLALQRSLLAPVLPEPDGVQMAVRYQPGVEGMEVGGDFYVAHQLGDGRLLLAIGDVMGRGIRAAAQMGQLRSVLLTLSYGGDPPDRVLDRLAAVVPELLDLELATLLLGLYDPAERLLLLASAGHPAPLLAPLDGRPHFLPVEPGPPLGTGPGRHRLHRQELPAGSTLVLYTDGLVERRDQGLTEGMEVLRRALSEIRLPPDAVADHVLRETGRDRGSDDDVALLVLSHLPTD